MPPGDVRPETLDAIVQAELGKKAQQKAALDMKVSGKSFREIGRIFEVSGKTAKQWVDKARQEQRLQVGFSVVTERLVPMALAVYEQRLKAGDLEAARDIVFGAGILSKQAKLVVQGGKDPLEAFREKYFGGEVVEALPAGPSDESDQSGPGRGAGLPSEGDED